MLRTDATPPAAAPNQRAASLLAPVYLVACALACGYLALHNQDAETTDWMGFGLLAATTLLPGYLWARRPQMHGFPLWPALCLSSFPAYAVPLVSDQANILAYAPELRLQVALVLAGFFALGTFLNTQFALRPLPAIRRITQVRFVGDPRAPLWLAMAALGFELNNHYGWINFGALYPVVRTLTHGMFLIGVYLHGASPPTQRRSGLRILFWLVFWVYGLLTLISLYLLPLISALAVMLVALVASQRRVPWLLLLAGGALIGLLQEGKGDMRQDVRFYGGADMQDPASVYDFYARWVDFALQRLETGHAYYQRAEQYSGALDRANLVHLSLRTLRDAPDPVPYLWGETYAQIPVVLAPRFLVPDKPWSLIATHMLNIHYGIQTADQVYDTTIGWGLINEAHANFGVLGVLVLGGLLGIATGMLARHTRGLPADAWLTLFAFSLIPVLTNTEMTSTVMAATLFQQGVVFLGLFLMLTRQIRLESGPAQTGRVR